jgi:hypothetical protein
MSLNLNILNLSYYNGQKIQVALVPEGQADQTSKDLELRGIRRLGKLSYTMEMRVFLFLQPLGLI